MRYFKVYRKCCVCANTRFELSEDRLEDLLWECANNRAYEELDSEGELEDETADDDAFYRNLEALDERAGQLFDDFLTETKSENGFCAGEFYLYAVTDDKSIWDFDRQN